MNDGNDKHEGAWWGNLETLKPSQVQSDYSYHYCSRYRYCSSATPRWRDCFYRSFK